jgi:hypothetical protein
VAPVVPEFLPVQVTEPAAAFPEPSEPPSQHAPSSAGHVELSVHLSRGFED